MHINEILDKIKALITSISKSQFIEDIASETKAALKKFNNAADAEIQNGSIVPPDLKNQLAQDFRGGKTVSPAQKQSPAANSPVSNNKEAEKASLEKRIADYKHTIEKRNMTDRLLKTVINSTPGCTYIEQIKTGRDSSCAELDIPFGFIALKDGDKYTEIDAIAVGANGVFVIRYNYNIGGCTFTNSDDGTVYAQSSDGDRVSLNENAIRIFKVKKILRQHFDSSVPLHSVLVLINDDAKCETDENANMHVVTVNNLGSYMAGFLEQECLNEEQRTEIIKKIESLRLSEEEVDKINEKK